MIHTQDLRKRYGPVTALDGIDLDLAAGQVVAILGPNGAGKTTLIECLLGLRRPDAGHVEVFGMPPGDPRVRARVGAMLQDSDAPPMLTVTESVDLVRAYYPIALSTGDILRYADLHAKADERVGALSGGQRQRLNFALSIAGDPDVLFLDEPTASLDIDARATFWTHVRSFAARGVTVLFASHHLDEVAGVADRVLVVKAGRIVADGDPSQVAALAGGRRVGLATDADATWFTARTDVRGVDTTGDVHDGLTSLVVWTPAPEAVLSDLFATGAHVADLHVGDADLETAFRHLTREVTA